MFYFLMLHYKPQRNLQIVFFENRIVLPAYWANGFTPYMCEKILRFTFLFEYPVLRIHFSFLVAFHYIIFYSDDDRGLVAIALCGNTACIPKLTRLQKNHNNK